MSDCLRKNKQVPSHKKEHVLFFKLLDLPLSGILESGKQKELSIKWVIMQWTWVVQLRLKHLGYSNVALKCRKFCMKITDSPSGESWGRVAKKPDYEAFRLPILL